MGNYKVYVCVCVTCQVLIVEIAKLDWLCESGSVPGPEPFPQRVLVNFSDAAK